MAICIKELIEQGKGIKEGLTKVPPPHHVMRNYSVYRLRDVDEYYRWKETTYRYLQLNYSIDAERFIGYANEFEKHSCLPQYISNMIGILEACNVLPSATVKMFNEVMERNEEMETVLKYEQKYCSISLKDDVSHSINAFHEWHAAASVLFDKWFYPSDPDWIKFQDITSDGNAYVLKSEFNKIFSSYKILMARLNDGRSLKNTIAMNSAKLPIKHVGDGTKISVFISYAHVDTKWLEKLQEHLKVISKYYNHIDYWDDTRLRGGDKWREEISKAISHAKVAILLVSTAFLASDFISNNELPPILRKAQEDGTRILPLIVSPCAFEESELADFQAINSPDRTLADLGEGSPESERVFLELARCIRDLQ